MQIPKYPDHAISVYVIAAMPSALWLGGLLAAAASFALPSLCKKIVSLCPHGTDV